VSAAQGIVLSEAETCALLAACGPMGQALRLAVGSEVVLLPGQRWALEVVAEMRGVPTHRAEGTAERLGVGEEAVKDAPRRARRKFRQRHATEDPQERS